MSLKKYLPYAIFTLLLIFFPISAFADLVPMECMQLGKELPRYCMYGNYKGPLYPEIMRINPLIDLFANFSLVFIATSVLAFLIKKRLSIRTILYTVALLTAVGSRSMRKRRQWSVVCTSRPIANNRHRPTGFASVRRISAIFRA